MLSSGLSLDWPHVYMHKECDSSYTAIDVHTDVNNWNNNNNFHNNMKKNNLQNIAQVMFLTLFINFECGHIEIIAPLQSFCVAWIFFL